LGAQRALRLLLDGGTLTAQDALQTGMVSELSDEPLAAALELAERYTRLDPRLARNIKRAVRLAESGDFEASLEFESWAQADSAGNPALAEAIERFR